MDIKTELDFVLTEPQQNQKPFKSKHARLEAEGLDVIKESNSQQNSGNSNSFES